MSAMRSPNLWCAVIMMIAISLGVCADAASATVAPPDLTVNLDGNDQGRVFDGIGGLSAGANSRLLIDYPEPQRSQILDYLFKPNFGASLQVLKVEIGGAGNSTWGSEASYANTRDEFEHPKPEYFKTGYEWWLLKEAKKRNPDIILESLQWCAPGWIGNGTFYSEDNINYIVGFIKAARDYHGVTIDYQGIWNERAYDVAWIKKLRTALDDNGLQHVKLVAADGAGYEAAWAIAKDMSSDSELSKAVYAVGGHYVGYASSDAAKGLGKPLWTSEESQSGDPWARADGYARLYNRDYIVGRMTKTIICSLITSNYIYLAPWGVLPWADPGLMRACTPWSRHYDVPPTIWAAAHTTQFTKPGWRYLDGGCGLMGDTGSYVTLRDPGADGDYSVIVETMKNVGYENILSRKDTAALPNVPPRRVTFNVSNLSTGTVHVWRTSKASQFEQLPDIIPQAGSFTITLDGNSIYTLTTTTGQHKGSSDIPADSAFPIPHKENFESYSTGAMAKYFCDQEGWFQVARRDDGHGKCLRQVVPQRPTEWGGIQAPWTIIGDIGWTDYEVSADVRIETTGLAGICGRIDNPLGGSMPGGYALTIDNAGNWQVKDTTATADSGMISLTPGSWHNLKLRFGGTTGIALIDGQIVSIFLANAHPKGAAGLVSSYNYTDYDNFSVKPYQVGPSAAVSGTLRDATTGQPVGCAVVIGGISASTTDSTGAFSVRSPIGPATIWVKSGVYDDSRTKVTVPSGGLSSLNLTIKRRGGNLTWAASGASAAGGANPEAAIDGNPCTSWTMQDGGRNGWLTIEWPTPQVIDTLIIRKCSAYMVNIDVWRDGAWLKVANIGDDVGSVSLPLKAEWSPISTTKIRLRNLISATDVETYNLHGLPATPNLIGTVRRASDRSPLKNVTVTAPGASTNTDESGRYRLSVPAGTTVRVDVSRLAYDTQGRDVAVPPTGSATADFELTTKNVAPLATASANNIYSSEYGPSLGNDDDLDTRYSAAGTYPTNWYELDWPEPVTVNRVIAYQLFPWESNLGIDYWDGAAWRRLSYLSGVPLTIDASFAPVTTTKLRLWEVSCYFEVVVESAAPVELP